MLLAQGRRVRRTTPRLPEAPGPRAGEAAAPGDPIHLLVIGESTAAGVGAPSHHAGLAGNVARTLAAESGHAVRWRVLGRNGATAESARAGLLADAGTVRADVAVVVLGVNDSLRFHRSARWRRDLAALVAAVRERSGDVPVVIAGVPEIGRFPALPWPLRSVLGVRARLLDLAAARLARELPAAAHVAIPDFGAASAEPYFCADRFHPSVRGYELWGAALGRAAARLVASSSR